MTWKQRTHALAVAGCVFFFFLINSERNRSLAAATFYVLMRSATFFFAACQPVHFAANEAVNCVRRRWVKQIGTNECRCCIIERQRCTLIGFAPRTDNLIMHKATISTQTTRYVPLQYM